MAGRSMLAMAVVLPFALVLAFPALATSSPVIDGNYDDWIDKPQAVDLGGADDETAPARSDITMASAFTDRYGVYMLMAWDDSDFPGGNESTAGATLHVPSGEYYRIYGTAMDEGTVPPNTIQVYSCTDSTCGTQTPMCTSEPCAGVTAASSPPTLPDPFAGRANPGCTGTNCGSVDTSVELFVPWDFVGGAPEEGLYTFFNFGSYPSGPGQGPKDDLGPIGVTCRFQAGTYDCYVSDPSAVQTAGSRVAAERDYGVPLAVACGLSILVGLVVVRRRKS